MTVHTSSPVEVDIWRSEKPDEGPIYLYKWMAEHLGKRIEAGEFPPNTRLPNESRLALEYGVALGTARQATRILRLRGLLVTVPAKGTFVTKRNS